MKTLSLLMMFVLMMQITSCNSEEPTPKTFTSLEGKWKFTSSVSNGDFTVDKENKITTGKFTLDGITYVIDNQSVMVDPYIILMKGDTKLQLNYPVVDKTYTTIKCESITYGKLSSLKNKSEIVVVERD